MSDQPALERSSDIARLSHEYTLFSWCVQEQHHPIVIAGGSGSRFWDAEGKTYLDFSSQLMNLNLGHQHPKVVAAIQKQANAFCYAAPQFATEAKARLGQLIADVTPGDLKKTFFALGGGEANDAAIKIARAYTGRQKIIARYHSYHGATFGAMTLTGEARRLHFEPGIPGIIHSFDPYCYRCTFGQDPATCHRECVSHIEEIIQYEGPDKVAAIFVEAVTGSNGVHVPVPDYFPRLRALCDKYGILLVDDEVMTGWGRTGEWFAINHWGVVPDIITTAKGITSGYVPLSAVIVSEKIGNYFEDKLFATGLTYSGHPLACAAGIACIEAYQDERLVENARDMGIVLAGELARLKKKHPSVGDARSLGLFSAIELVKNRDTRAPLYNGRGGPSIKEIDRFLLSRGVFTFCKDAMILIAPPLCITKDELLEGMAVVDEALALADQRMAG